MPRKKRSLSSQPGLFDSLDDFVERLDPEFELIPPKEMERIAQLHSTRPMAIDPLPPLTESDNIFFMSFGSGSSGNCSYIGDRSGGFLIDAGVDAKKVISSLHDNGISPDKIYGIILTHDHHDHISQAYALLRNHRNIRLFCTPRTLSGILRRHNISRRIRDYHTPIYKEHPFKLGNFELTPFEVMHDGADNAGYFITHGERSIAVATDLGCISPRVDHYMRMADTIVIESNYDLHMLMTGTYPEYLKARILAENGHLDNRVSAKFIADIYTPRLRNLYLCHLSHDNNLPRIAVDTFTEVLADIAPGLTPIPLPRYTSTPLYTL